MKILAGLPGWTRDASAEGADATSPPERRSSSIRHHPQELSLMPNLTPRQNIHRREAWQLPFLLDERALEPERAGAVEPAH